MGHVPEGVTLRSRLLEAGDLKRDVMEATTVSTDLVVVEDPSGWAEAGAVAGFLAAYGGSTRVSYATDLRLFSAWCREANLTLFSVRRAHLELFGPLAR